MTNQPFHRTGRVRSGDVELHYRRFGDAGGGVPLLILHGLSFFSYDWIAPAAALASDREVVAMDLRGFGESGWSPTRDYRLQTFAADIPCLLDALGWEKAVLVGHSMGGRIGLAAAAWHPDRAAGLVSIDFAPDVGAAGRRKVAERIGRQPDRFRSVDEALAYHGLDPRLPAAAPVRRRFEAFLRSVEDGFVLKRDLHFRDNFRQVLETGKAPPLGVDLWALLAGLEIPILVLRGSASDMFEAPTLAKARAANPRLSALEIAGGHDLARDNPEAVVAAVRDFMRNIDGIARTDRASQDTAKLKGRGS